MKIFLSLIVLVMLCPAANAKGAEFDQFVEGALVVYSQFKRPSKEESERFYSFVQTKWSAQDCSNNCGKLGYIAAKQYVKEKNIQIKDVQPRKGVV